MQCGRGRCTPAVHTAARSCTRRARSRARQVDLFYVRGERKVSLRFLAYALLSARIQRTVHDSVEDARTALALYRHYEELQRTGALQQTLTRLYREGHRLGWAVPNDE